MSPYMPSRAAGVIFSNMWRGACSQRSTYLHTMAIGLTDNFALSGTDAILSVVPMFHGPGPRGAGSVPLASPL